MINSKLIREHNKIERDIDDFTFQIQNEFLDKKKYEKHRLQCDEIAAFIDRDTYIQTEDDNYMGLSKSHVLFAMLLELLNFTKSHLYMIKWQYYMNKVISKMSIETTTIINNDCYLNQLMNLLKLIEDFNKEIKITKDFSSYQKHQLYQRLRDIIQKIEMLNNYIKKNYSYIFKGFSKVYKKN